jgi:hypothetical protein
MIMLDEIVQYFYLQLLYHAKAISDPDSHAFHASAYSCQSTKICSVQAAKIPAYFPCGCSQLPSLALYKSSARENKHPLST